MKILKIALFLIAGGIIGLTASMLVASALQPAVDSLPPDSLILHQPGTIGQWVFWLCQMVAGAFLTWLSTGWLKKIRGVTEAYTMILAVLISGFLAWGIDAAILKFLKVDIGLNVKMMALFQWTVAAIVFKAQKAGQLFFNKPAATTSG